LAGTKRFFKSTWKSFKVEFKETEESLSAAKDEVMEELRLASEQEAHGFRCLLTAEIEENRILRLGQVAEMEENKYFRSQQTLALQQTQARQIQKIMKEEGKRYYHGKEIVTVADSSPAVTHNSRIAIQVQLESRAFLAGWRSGQSC
jgi:hypothetical protein